MAKRNFLLDYDPAYYRRWIERARSFAAAPGQPPARLRAVEWLAPRYEAASEELLALPRTIIHGEFYASNVLVAGDPADPRVAPVDWELAASAPGVVDLAALVSGGWSDEDREAIAAAYRTTAGPFSPLPRELDSRSAAPGGAVAGLGGAELAPAARAAAGLARRGALAGRGAGALSPARWLIVNADDLGLSAGVNAGIVEAHERGIVTSASLMVRADAAAGGGRARPRASRARRRSAPRPRRVGYEAAEWRVAYERCAPDDPAAVEAECRGQLGAFRELIGRDPTHLDSHQHVHMSEPVAAVAARLAAELEVPLRDRRDSLRGRLLRPDGQGRTLSRGHRASST